MSKLIEADEDKIKASIEVNRRIITREIATRLNWSNSKNEITFQIIQYFRLLLLFRAINYRSNLNRKRNTLDYYLFEKRFFVRLDLRFNCVSIINRFVLQFHGLEWNANCSKLFWTNGYTCNQSLNLYGSLINIITA